MVCDVCSSDRKAEPDGSVRVKESEIDLLNGPALISLRSEGFFHCSWCEKDYCRTHAAGCGPAVCGYNGPEKRGRKRAAEDIVDASADASAERPPRGARD